MPLWQTGQVKEDKLDGRFMGKNDFLLFLECNENEWEAYQGDREMTFQLFTSITGHLCRLELYELLMCFMKKYPYYSEAFATEPFTNEDEDMTESTLLTTI